MYVNFDNLHFPNTRNKDLFFENYNHVLHHSPHRISQKTQLLIENARTKIADYLNCFSGEIVFSASVYQNIDVLFNVLFLLRIKHLILLETEKQWIIDYIVNKAQREKIEISFVDFTSLGVLDLKSLESLLVKNNNSFLYLSHLNNYSGIFVPTKKIAQICKKYHCFWALDCSESLPLINIDLSQIQPDIAFFSSQNLSSFLPIHAIFLSNNLISDSEFEHVNFLTKRKFSLEHFFAIDLFSSFLNDNDQRKSSVNSYFKELQQYFFTKSENLKTSVLVLFKNLKNTSPQFVHLLLPYSDFWIERFDIEGIAVHELSFTNKKLFIENKSFILLSFSEENTKDQIDYFIDKLNKILG
jgi:selenocysteine lyase/cysteine desulfurase